MKLESKKPLIKLYSLGGTISSSKTESGTSGVSPSLTGSDLVKLVPGIDKLAVIEASSFSKIASGDLSYELIRDLAKKISKDFQDGIIQGVVVTQGTDTTEETSFLLELLVDSDNPIVITGAMRNPTLAGPDGPANIYSAVLVASKTESKGMGSLVVFNDEIHAARFVRKTHTSNPATFKSEGFGPVGYTVENKVRFGFSLKQLPVFNANSLDNRIPKIGLIKFTFGDDDTLLNLIEGYDGLIIEGFGGGHVPSSVVPILEKLADKIPVILASRTGSGEMLTCTYGFPGSESDLLARGLISSGPLNSLKAKVLLTMCIAKGLNKKEISSTFLNFL